MLDLHEKIDGLEQGDACALGQFASLTPHPPFELFIFTGQSLSRCLSSIRSDENISRYDDVDSSGRNSILEEGLLGKVVY